MYNVDMQYKFLRIQDMLIFCLKMKRKEDEQNLTRGHTYKAIKRIFSPLNFNKKHLTIVALVSQKKKKNNKKLAHMRKYKSDTLQWLGIVAVVDG